MPIRKSVNLSNQRSTSQGRKRAENEKQDNQSIYHKLLARNVRYSINPNSFYITDKNNLSNKRKSQYDYNFQSLSQTQRIGKSFNKENLIYQGDDEMDLKISKLLDSNKKQDNSNQFSKTVQIKNVEENQLQQILQRMKDFEFIIEQQEKEIEELREMSENQEYLKQENSELKQRCKCQQEKISRYQDLQEQLELKFGELIEENKKLNEIINEDSKYVINDQESEDNEKQELLELCRLLKEENDLLKLKRVDKKQQKNEIGSTLNRLKLISQNLIKEVQTLQ